MGLSIFYIKRNPTQGQYEQLKFALILAHSHFDAIDQLKPHLPITHDKLFITREVKRMGDYQGPLKKPRIFYIEK